MKFVLLSDSTTGMIYFESILGREILGRISICDGDSSKPKVGICSMKIREIESAKIKLAMIKWKIMLL